MLDLNTRVNLDEVVPSHLVNQELSSTRISVPDTLRKLDGVGQNRLSDLLRQVGSRRNLNDLLMTTLDRAVTLKEVNGVTSSVGKNLDFDVTGTFEEALNEDGAVTKG